MTSGPGTPHSVGQPIPRADGLGKVTGEAQYTADVQLPGTLWGKTLRSPFAHARIVRIDTSQAKALPGVRAVLNGRDVAGHRFGRRIVDVPLLAEDHVRFIGEQVAAVAADDENIAQQALDLIEIEYEELPAIFDPLEAMKPGAPLLHPDVQGYAGLPFPLDAPSNVVVNNEWGKGDVAQGFAEADVIVENTFTVPLVHQAYLEAHSCLVMVDDDGRVQVWAPTKAPYATKSQVASAIGVEPKQVRINPVTIGGDFGGKGSPMNIPLCYFLAKATGAPVRMVLDYLEELMAANPRHPAVMRLKTGVMNDGALVAQETEIVFNSGAYAGFKPVGFLPGASAGAGPYHIPHARVTSAMVYTNMVPCGHMRGPGEPQAIFAIESQIDCVAKAIGMDPLEVRRKNLVREGEETSTGHAFQELRAVETLEAAVEAARFTSVKAAGIGRGIAMGDRAPGGGETHASIALNPDGTVNVSTPIFEQGSGTYTLVQQVVADGLGLPPNRVTIGVLDTDAVEFDSGVGGSRVTRIGSQVAYAAAEAVQTELAKLAAELLGWPEDQVRLAGDTVTRADTGESQPWVAMLQRTGEPVVASATIKDTTPSLVTAFTAQIAEVSVDRETGEVTLLRLTTAHDAGRVLNPLGHQGQINGGVMQGIGYGLMEELLTEDGRVSTLSFADFKIPTMADIPELSTVILESESGVGPLHVKGIGENPNSPTAAAIANAVADAVGARIHNLPVTAEKVYRALNVT